MVVGMSAMHIIITGGCGFVGFNLARSLAEAGHQITVFDNLVRRGSEINVSKLLNLGIPFLHGDIRNPEDFTELPDDVDCLIECSAQPSVVAGYTNPLYDFTTNVVGVMNCLEFCRMQNIGMIFLSSSRVYPASKINALPRVERESRWDWDADVGPQTLPCGFHPVEGIGAQFDLDGATKTIYGASKVAADFFCQEYADAFGLPIIVNRCGVIAGEGQFGVIGQGWLTFWAMCCLLGRPLTYFGHKGKQVRDVLFIEDLCTLVRTQIDRLEGLAGRVWNVGGGRLNSLSLVEATTLMERLVNKRIIASHREEPRKGDVVIYITDNTEITSDLGWKPNVSLEQGSERIVRWVSDNRSALLESGL
jgi:CDP-paratose 2-epimerase